SLGYVLANVEVVERTIISSRSRRPRGSCSLPPSSRTFAVCLKCFANGGTDRRAPARGDRRAVTLPDFEALDDPLLAHDRYDLQDVDIEPEEQSPHAIEHAASFGSCNLEKGGIAILAGIETHVGRRHQRGPFSRGY